MSARHILDFHAGAPWAGSALETLERTAANAWGNPLHPSSEGRRAATWLEAASATVRQCTGLPHVSFHADRTAALEACLAAYPDLTVMASATHRKVALQHVDTVAPVDSDGTPTWGDSQLALEQAANEETGVIDPSAHASVRILDASSAFGRVAQLGAAEQTIADASAWGAPGHVALVVGQRPVPAREMPAVPLIVVAAQMLAERWSARNDREAAESRAMQHFEEWVLQHIPDVQFHGRHRVSHIRSFSVLHLDGETLMRALDEQGYVVGSGSACVADGTPSHVLAAMGCVTHGNVRLALPLDLDLAVLNEFAGVLQGTVARLRRETGVADL